MTLDPSYLDKIVMNFKIEAPPDKVVAISMSLAAYHHTVVVAVWHGKEYLVTESTDMLTMYQQLRGERSDTDGPQKH